jgi:hypothetical protein
MYLSKYGVARHIYLPIVKRAVVDFAVGADWTPAAGDVKISKDGGAAANVTNLPSAIVMGNAAMWDYSLTATEMQAAQVNVTVADSATKAVEDQFFTIQTYGHASALFQVDLADIVRMGLTALPNAVAGAVGGLPVGDANGAVLIRGLIKKNTAFPNFTFLLTDSTTHAPKTGVTVTATRRIDAGSFASCTNAATEVGNGWYTIDLSAADVNGRVISLRFTGTSTDDRNIQIITVD